MSLIGLICGIAAALALGAVMLYSARRSRPADRRLGPARTYLKIHLWGGLAFLLFFMLHTGFRVPAGVFALVLWGGSVWVVLTGIIGLALQKLIPRVIEPSSSFEVNLHRIPDLVAQLRERASAAAAASTEPRVRAYYEQRLAPAMVEPRMVTTLLRDPRQARRGTGEIDILKRTLAPEAIVALDELRELHATKHEIDVHFTLQRIMRLWLYLHLPVAIALLAIVVLHVFFVIYF